MGDNAIGGTLVAAEPCATSCCLQSFELYETRSNFYILGSDQTKTWWRILKIDRSEPSELNLLEDPASYTYDEYIDLLRRINEGNKSTGGLKFVTNCYGLIGFIKFLGPYYMLLITERKQVGAIFGHSVYEVTKSEMIVLTNSGMQSDLALERSENRYKKLFSTIDLTKDFFFSYSYQIMRSLQKNMFDVLEGQALYDTMFVWNQFLTQGIHNHLNNTVWTVALVYGFFKQDKLSLSGKDFLLTLIARRSRHYAGTRYLKRGINAKGRVANDVETEQIIFEDIPGGGPRQLSSVVQNRGSIPLFWSQETSKLTIKPDIILHKNDKNFEATKLHFENLRKRYGNPIIILNLIKKRERKPREALLKREFDRAIKVINQDLSDDDCLRFLHWDLHMNSQSKATNVLAILLRVASQALNMTGFFYCQLSPALRTGFALKWPIHIKDGYMCDDNSNSDYLDTLDILGDGSQEDISGSSDTSGNGTTEDKMENDLFFLKPPKFQKGVLRTNCIDCLDRTNVAQYAYGLAAIGHQLHSLGYLDAPELDLDTPLAHQLMYFYELMGDTLARQYGGSAAHNKIFSARRGHLKLAIQSQEFFRTLQRHYSNAYMDANKQAAINLFLGYFQPQIGRAALWELDSDQPRTVRDNSRSFSDGSPRSSMKRAQSEGNILLGSISTPVLTTSANDRHSRPDKMHPGGSSCLLSDLAQETSVDQVFLDHDRYTPSTPQVCRVTDNGIYYCDDSGDSNFLDLELLSSSGNLCGDDSCQRSTAVSSPVCNVSTENVMDGIDGGSISSSDGSSKLLQKKKISQAQDSGMSRMNSMFSESFIHWVDHGGTLFY